MKSKRSTLAVLGLFAALVVMPGILYGSQLTKTQHDHHSATAGTPESAAQMPAERPMMSMKASDSKLDELVNKMNAAKGGAKTDAMAELLTALVENRKTMCGPMMADMTTMMSMMKTMGDKGQDPEKTDSQK